MMWGLGDPMDWWWIEPGMEACKPSTLPCYLSSPKPITFVWHYLGEVSVSVSVAQAKVSCLQSLYTNSLAAQVFFFLAFGPNLVILRDNFWLYSQESLPAGDLTEGWGLNPSRLHAKQVLYLLCYLSPQLHKRLLKDSIYSLPGKYSTINMNPFFSVGMHQLV